MSAIGNFLLVRDDELVRLFAGPGVVQDFCERRAEAGGPDYVDVDTAWHCVHYLLAGDADGGAAPLDFIVCGGRELGVDMGYGPVRAFDPSELAAIARALESLTRDDLRGRFDAAEMDRLDIYPDGGRWSELDPRGVGLDGYLDRFDAIARLVRDGAAGGRGMLVWLA